MTRDLRAQQSISNCQPLTAVKLKSSLEHIVSESFERNKALISSLTAQLLTTLSIADLDACWEIVQLSKAREIDEQT